MMTEPDGFLGAVLAAQGCGLKAMINGPGGCRSRTVNLYRELSVEYSGEESGCCRSKYMSRQSNIPCTYLNSDDMILGSGNKISDGLSSVASATDKDIVLIDTLGASVQVTDMEAAVKRSGTEDRVILTDGDLSGLSLAEGFDRTVRSVMERTGLASGERKNSVAILGYSLADSSWLYGKRNISEILALLGITDVVFVGCGSDKEAIRKAGTCSASISIHPEMSSLTAEYLSDMGVRNITPRVGSPIGYPSIRSFVTQVSDALGLSPDTALHAVDEEERAVKKILNNCDKDIRGFRGQLMTLEAIPSDLLPLMEWMYDMFSLVPGSVRYRFSKTSPYDERITSFLDAVGCSGALGAEADPLATHAVFSDGLSARLYSMEHPHASCVEIGMPYSRKTELTDKSLVGFGGARYLLDSLVNDIGRFSCGQPTMADFR
jgi:nitrogenase molybdenum-iron protein alpha/beta subunit